MTSTLLYPFPDPGTEPLAAVIWEAFKPDTEPPRATRQDEIAAKREEILDLLRRARVARNTVSRPARSEQTADFVEEQGGIY